MPLQQHVVEWVQPMFHYAYKGIEGRMTSTGKTYQSEFVSTLAFHKVKQHFDLLLASLKKAKDNPPRCKEDKDDSVALEKNVASLAKEWESMWRFPGQVEDLSDSFELPLEFQSHGLEDTDGIAVSNRTQRTHTASNQN